jgi:Right handed beta helix region
VASENERWGIVASGGVGLWPPDHLMSQRYVVANNVCRANAAGGITIDPTLPEDHSDHDQIQDSFATVASNVCVANSGPGIRTGHAGYLAVRGNICDRNEDAGVGIVSSRYAVVADNVLTGNNSYGVGFWAGAGVQDVGHHLLGGNVYDKNKVGEIQIGPDHPAIRQLGPAWWCQLTVRRRAGSTRSSWRNGKWPGCRCHHRSGTSSTPRRRRRGRPAPR